MSKTKHILQTPSFSLSLVGYAALLATIVKTPGMDELALALPVAPVHDENCKGLCPVCGNDLNSDPCDGHEDGLDSPFAVLKDLLDS